jgi:Skp family chaperone for outer membrane proteins
MNRNLIASIVTAAVAAALMTGAIRTGVAQNNALTGRAAYVDVMLVMNECERWKAIKEEIAEHQEKLNAENTRRREALDNKLAAIDQMDENDPTLPERTRQLRAETLEYRIWSELVQQDMQAEIARWSVRVYREVQAAAETVARRDEYDFVFYKGQFSPASSDPQVIQQQIRDNQVLYANQAADMTQVVLDKLNADFRAEPRKPMIQIQY